MIQKKICMVGPVSVGKTSLVSRYVHSLFSEKYLSTVGVKVDKKTLSVNGEQVDLMLWDLAGDDDFQRLNLAYLRGAAGYLLVADCSRQGTLGEAAEIQSRVAKAVGAIPFILVLNKADLIHDWDLRAADLDLMEAKGWTIRRTSAKEGSGVDQVFREMAQLVVTGKAK